MFARLHRLHAPTKCSESSSTSTAASQSVPDSGLLTAATCRIASRLGRLANAGVKVAFTDRTTPARAYRHSIGAWLRRRTDDAKAEVLAITGQSVAA